MRKKILSVILSTVIALTALTPTANASSVKTATATSYDCEGSTSTYLCTSTDWEQRWGNVYCSCGCGAKTFTGIIDVRYCNDCGAQVYWQVDHHTGSYTCLSTGETKNVSYGPGQKDNLTHKYLPTPCEHNKTEAHTYCAAPYYDTTYGYKGDTSTFTVYTLSTSGCSVSKVTTSNYSSGLVTNSAISGATITLSLPSSNAWVVTVNGASYTVNGNSYTFTMPAKDTTISATLASFTPTVALSNLTVGQSAQITPNAPTGSTVTYSSSNASGLTVSTSGAVTAKKVGTYTITVKATL